MHTQDHQVFMQACNVNKNGIGYMDRKQKLEWIREMWNKEEKIGTQWTHFNLTWPNIFFFLVFFLCHSLFFQVFFSTQFSIFLFFPYLFLSFQTRFFIPIFLFFFSPLTIYFFLHSLNSCILPTFHKTLRVGVFGFQIVKGL